MRINEVISTDLDEGVNDPHIFKAIFVVGPPGAGKNTVITELGLTGKGLKLGDVDDTLAFLQRSKRTNTADYAASLEVTKRRQSVWQQGHLGVLINTTGREADAIKQLKDSLAQIGYSTFLLFVDVNEDIAAQRIASRKASATAGRDAGREVTRDYFKSAFKQSKENIEFFALMFGSNFALVTNNELLVKGMPVDETIQRAEKKINRFLAAPLSTKAQAIIDAAKSR